VEGVRKLKMGWETVIYMDFGRKKTDPDSKQQERSTR